MFPVGTGTLVNDLMTSIHFCIHRFTSIKLQAEITSSSRFSMMKPFLGLSSLHRPWTINPSILERMPYPRRMDFSFFNVNRSPVNINQINQEKAQNLHMEMAKLPRPPN
ncbi:hypothetical protein CISG_03950 [Coccidioides immitis RMSCC 3703]|uniref:Uncharacterized protein n=1 Tax=Coccidioides immitis RMSCC 3703 TaxID=454286 RepID=A0A0J8TJR7_COCIT|nr:hypothetical protein CISG_03950 [Coccidioides immitis RMSCC 3703]